MGTLGTPHRWCSFVWYRVSLLSYVVKAYAMPPGGGGVYPILYPKTRRSAARFCNIKHGEMLPIFLTETWRIAVQFSTMKTRRNAARNYVFCLFRLWNEIDRRTKRSNSIQNTSMTMLSIAKQTLLTIRKSRRHAM